MYAEKIKSSINHLMMRFNYIDPSNDYVDVLNYRHMPIIYNASHARRMEEARQYLRGRKKYYIEQRGGWIPTKASQTDVTKTWAEYREQTQ